MKKTVNKILIVTDDAGESYEILYAKHRFEEEGWTAHIGATKKKHITLTRSTARRGSADFDSGV